MRRAETLTDNQSKKLDALLKVNEWLHTAYVLKESFRQLWDYVYPKNAQKHLHRQCEWAIDRACGVKDLDYLSLKLRQESLA